MLPLNFEFHGLTIRTNISILEELGNIPENWLQNEIMRREFKYFGQGKRHECLERYL